MAIVANTYLTYDARGLREQLSDVIYNISPEETPFVSNARKGSVDGTYFEWQTDSLAAAAANDQLEGDEATFAAVVPTLRLANYVQISRKTLIIAGTEERVDKAGRKSEIAYQTAKLGAELRRDMEFVAVQNQAARAGNSTTSRRTAGFESFLITNASRGAGGLAPTLSGSTQGYPNAAPTDGTQRAFTEALLKTVLQLSWANGGKGQMLMVGGLQKQVVSGFAGIAEVRKSVEGASQAVIVGAADVYVGDFGNVSIVPNRFSRNRSALLIDPSHIEIVMLRPFMVEDLAKTGDASKKLMLVEWGTKVHHEASQGIVADLS
jgi:hypothetical protein